MTSPFAWFVWMAGMRGPTPQKWSRQTFTREGKTVPTLAQHPITQEEWDTLSCAELAKKYPPPREDPKPEPVVLPPRPPAPSAAAAPVAVPVLLEV